MNENKSKPITISTIIIIAILLIVAFYVKENPDTVGSFIGGIIRPDK